MTGAIARRAYEEWLGRGIYLANAVTAVSRKMYSFGMEMGYAETNPFSTFKRKTPHARNTVWTKEQLVQFLDVAYSEFKYRNIGLIVQMAYEWCQRVGDMRMLQFTTIDFDKSVLNLQQSKRRSVVHLPISLDLLEMLKQQKEEYDFQPYVAPYPTAKRGVYSPYSIVRLSKVARTVLNLAGLPTDLRISDLRRTGTTEMVEAGVSMGQIMSVTGHANPQSVKPYMKNTYASAENALTLRNNHGKSS
jgi:integrase